MPSKKNLEEWALGMCLCVCAQKDASKQGIPCQLVLTNCAKAQDEERQQSVGNEQVADSYKNPVAVPR